MEAQLEQLLASAKQAVQAFEGPLAQDVDAALSLSPDNTSAQSGVLRAKIEETIQTLHKLEQIITPPQVLFMDAVFAATSSKVLLCASRYGFADILEQRGPLTIPELAAATDVQPTAAHQLMRYLIDELGFFQYDQTSTTPTVRNNRASALLRTDHWTTWHNWVDQYATTHYSMLTSLPDAVSARSSRSAAQHFYDTDESTYAVMQAQGLTAGFHRAIGAFSVAEAPGLLADYPWGDELVGGAATLTDVGAGQGDFVAHYLRAFPRAKAVAFDLPGTADLIRKRFEREAWAGGRAQVRAGDFFADDNQLPASEVYFLRLVFHNWDDDKCVRILEKVREAMVLRPGVSRVLVVEMVIREGRLGSFARYGDIRMLTMVKNKERTLDEYREIARKGGFEITDVITPRGCLSQVLDLRPVY
ncbi:o-methyltransferase 2 [Diplodia corticola]|uniref:O-methyltransferase 2 n=1 Tax=Diplodia corticola TaxID=236234 RepID=A0A1J9QNF8_9PEZI|nr:o-methyltransferase 2 [Diplodia corticola]OJD30438.1 o-methyltransferase 2 [Diplodia corticola]